MEVGSYFFALVSFWVFFVLQCGNVQDMKFIRTRSRYKGLLTQKDFFHNGGLLI